VSFENKDQFQSTIEKEQGETQGEEEEYAQTDSVLPHLEPRFGPFLLDAAPTFRQLGRLSLEKHEMPFGGRFQLNARTLS